jgi:hypothetical protein
MNLFFGVASLDESGKTDITNFSNKLAEAAGKIYNQAITEHGPSTNMKIGCMSDKGSIAGIAARDGICIVLLSCLHRPIPEWDSGSPLDDPNATAEHLLKLYQKNGKNFLDKVYGQFAVAVLDSKKNSVFLAIDRNEIRMLYYVLINNTICFCTNLYLLAHALREHIGYDRSYEDFFLIYGIMPPQRTFFEGIQSVPPSTIIEFTNSDKHFHSIADSNPWDKTFANTDWSSYSQDQATDRLYDAFMTALEEQSASAKRAAVLLGGFDSSLVAAGLVRLGKEVETFTYQYSDESYNQPNVDTLQKFLGHKHHWIRVTEEDLRAGLMNYSYRYNKPTNWPNYVVQTHKLCDEIRRLGILHCYSGDGCDDVFLGYPIVHLRARLFGGSFRLPIPILNFMLTLAKVPYLENIMGHVYTVWLNVCRSLARKWPERGYLTFRVFDELCLQKLRKNNCPEQAFTIDEILAELTHGLENLSPDRLAYLGKFVINPNWVKMTGSSDCTGIAIHSPFIHAGMAKFSRGIPDYLCRPKEKTESKITGKYILMKMAEKKKLLSYDSIYQRKFPAVDAPIDDWYQGPLNETVLGIIKHLPFDYDKKYVESMTRKKVVESIYKKIVPLDRICSSLTISLLSTYASFTKALSD